MTVRVMRSCQQRMSANYAAVRIAMRRGRLDAPFPFGAKVMMTERMSNSCFLKRSSYFPGVKPGKLNLPFASVTQDAMGPRNVFCALLRLNQGFWIIKYLHFHFRQWFAIQTYNQALYSLYCRLPLLYHSLLAARRDNGATYEQAKDDYSG